MVATTYFWDPIEDNVVESFTDSGSTTAYFTEPMKFGPVISVQENSAVSVLHSDALGSVLSATDSTQAVVGTWSYSAFGETTESTSAAKGGLLYCGKAGYLSTSNGDLAVRHRLMSPSKARWLSVDPEYPFRYEYVNNVPTLLLDPSGLGGIEWALVGCYTTIPAPTNHWYGDCVFWDPKSNEIKTKGQLDCAGFHRDPLECCDAYAKELGYETIEGSIWRQYRILTICRYRSYYSFTKPAEGFINEALVAPGVTVTTGTCTGGPKLSPGAGPALIIIGMIQITGVILEVGLEKTATTKTTTIVTPKTRRKKKDRKCMCRSKARNWKKGKACYLQIFEEFAKDCETAKALAHEACVKAECHKPRDGVEGGDCGHDKCYERPN